MTGHVMVVRPDSEGDVLLAGPAVRAVAADARTVTLWCGPRGRHAARLLPGVDAVLCHVLPWIDPEPSAARRDDIDRLVDELAALEIDEAVILTSFHQSPLPTALLLRMAGVGRVGAISEHYPGSLLDVRHHAADGLHEVERGLSLAAAMGHEPPAGDDTRLRVAGLPAQPRLPPGTVVLHPGASVQARAWPPARHAELAAALSARGWPVAVTGTVAEQHLTRPVIAAAGHRGIDLCGQTTFGELGAALRSAAAVVVGNTGPAHLAAAVGTPVISVYAPTVPAERWQPWGVPHELLTIAVPCAGCRARTCPVLGHPCMSGITAADALAAVERLVPAPAWTVSA